MRQPEKYFCDMCGEEITSETGFIERIIQVVTACDWEDGHGAPLHVEGLKMDLCKDCYAKAFNIRCGFRGENPKFIHE